jgi:hypothetical protein
MNGVMMANKIMLLFGIMLISAFSVKAASIAPKRMIEPVPVEPVASPPSSSTVALTVNDLLYVSKLEEVRKMVGNICWKERQAFISTGHYASLPATSVFIPAVEPVMVYAPAWESMGIFPSGTSLLFRYRVDTSGTGLNAKFTAIAESDLDGDSVSSLLSMNGYVDANGVAKCTEVDGVKPLE